MLGISRYSPLYLQFLPKGVKINCIVEVIHNDAKAIVKESEDTYKWLNLTEGAFK